MPLGLPQPTTSYPGNGMLAQPYYLRDPQKFAVDQERQRHNQALYTLGEWTMFCLMWHIQDYTNGLVTLCPVCADDRYALAYQQPERNKCPNCFGTTFNGGYKALIVRPAIFSDTDEGQAFQARGVVNSDDLDMESTTDFRVRSGDYCFRSTGDRFFLRVPQRITLRTGFATPYQRDMAVGYNHAKASLEDPSTVCYTIPPAAEDLVTILSVHSYEPVDFAQFEVIRAPLIPVDDLG